MTPHLALRTEAQEGIRIREFDWPLGETILSEETSASMRFILEQVVAEGSGKKAALPGWRIGGKTATSEKLPRSRKKYISSFIGFAPAQDPEVIALITIDEPSGVYYGGTIAAPVIGSLFDDSEERAQYEKLLAPLVMLDPVPFDSPDQANPDFLLQSAVWAVLKNEDTSRYATDQTGAVLLPAADVDLYGARLYGSDIKLPTGNTRCGRALELDAGRGHAVRGRAPG